MEKKFVLKRKASKKRRVLVLCYSQTGQLTSGVRSMMEPLEDSSDVEVVFEELKPRKPYPFPWPVLEFMDVFPESVYMEPPEMEPVSFDPDSHFDLVVLAYQVWFLSPSLPITGFLRSDAARVLKGKPVVTFIACRNMWLTAQEKMKVELAKLGARHIDNAVLVDQGPPWATFVTTPRWLWSGKKNGFWRVFPPAGVSKTDISGAVRFGRALLDGLRESDGPPEKPLLRGLGAVKVNPRYIAGEKIAHRSFLIWGALLRRIGEQGSLVRKPFVLLYLCFLLVMIATVLPISIAVRAVLYPFIRSRLDESVKRFEEPSGSSTECMNRYSNQPTNKTNNK